MKVERIVIAGDWHAHIPTALDVIAHARRNGAFTVLHVGDLGYRFEPVFVDTIEAALRAWDMTLYFVEGNHDDADLLASLPTASRGERIVSPRIRHMPRGHTWTWSGVRFMAVGGAVSVDQRRRMPGLEWWPQESLTAADVEQCRRRGPVDVVVSHDCPAGVPLDLPSSSRWPEDLLRASEQHRRMLLHAIERGRPRLLVHGHYHLRHDTVADLGWGPMRVVGLHRDGRPLDENAWLVDLAELRRGHALR